jgi:hypothetical protein
LRLNSRLDFKTEVGSSEEKDGKEDLPIQLEKPIDGPLREAFGIYAK